MNKAWHLTHRMPKKATLGQRIEWHLSHAKACACRPMPEAIRKAIKLQDTSASRG